MGTRYLEFRGEQAGIESNPNPSRPRQHGVALANAESRHYSLPREINMNDMNIHHPSGSAASSPYPRPTPKLPGSAGMWLGMVRSRKVLTRLLGLELHACPIAATRNHPRPKLDGGAAGHVLLSAIRRFGDGADLSSMVLVQVPAECSLGRLSDASISPPAGRIPASTQASPTTVLGWGKPKEPEI